MPGRNPILSLKQEHSMRKTKNLSAETTSVMPARKIRIIYHDPYATDSSSDEEGYSERNPKRVVREVVLPSVDSVQPSKTPETESSFQGANNGAKPSTVKYRGVRYRKSGRWAAEIHDRIQGRRLWLGTFSTPEEASRAYEKKRLEIEELTNNMSEKGSCSIVKKIGSVASSNAGNADIQDSSESVAFLISHTYPPSLLEMDCLTSAPVSASATIVRPSESVFVDESASLAQIVPGMDFDMAFDSIVTPDEILSLDDVGLQPIDFADDVFQDLLIAGFEEQGPCSLPDFDIDFDFDFDGYNKSFDSMDEVAAPRMNVGTSLNIACL